jgi:hypothetical protein
MDIINKCLTLSEFRDYVKTYDFGTEPANKLVIHHTWRPTKKEWKGEKSILAMKGHYERKGWKAGPHLFIANDGIWLFSPMRRDGVHASKLNRRSIGIEVVGNYNSEVWSGRTKVNALGVIKGILERLSLTENNIYFHSDVSTKTCPGKAITKEWLFYELTAFKLKPRIPNPGGLPDVLRNTTAPVPVDYYASDDMVLIQVPDWAAEAVNFVARNRLFKIRRAEDVRDAVKYYRFYNLIKKEL